MKLLIFALFISNNIFATTSIIKFTATTNGPGISVEGEAKNINQKIDFKKLEGSSISFDILNLTTGMEKRDIHLHEKVFNTTALNQNKIEFSLAKTICPENNSECELNGTLKIKDVSNEIKFKAKVNVSNESIEGKTTVSLSQFKLNAPSFMGVTVEDNVQIEFKVTK